MWLELGGVWLVRGGLVLEVRREFMGVRGWGIELKGRLG